MLSVFAVTVKKPHTIMTYSFDDDMTTCSNNVLSALYTLIHHGLVIDIRIGRTHDVYGEMYDVNGDTIPFTYDCILDQFTIGK